MPCQQCVDSDGNPTGKWKWGENGECRYDSREECERANRDNASEARAPQRVIDAIAANSWAITEPALQQILAIATGMHEKPEAVQLRLGRPLDDTRSVEIRDGVAVVPIVGPIFRYANLFTEISGATSIEMAALDFQRAVDDPQVRAIVLNVDSPGGMVAGVAEFANAIHAADKPVVAYVGDMAASAGYWLAAATDQVLVGPTAEIGSVGAVIRVRRARDDNSLEIVSTQSPLKRPDPDTEAGRAAFQRRIDSIAQVFLDSVATFRGVDVETVLSQFGQGDLLIGQAAVDAGMADGVSSLEAVIADLQAQVSTRGVGTMSNEITRDTIADNHPNIANAFRKEGYDEGHKEALEQGHAAGLEEGRAAGRAEELARIKAVKDQSIPGHEALVEQLMFDGETTGEQAAIKILNAEREARAGTRRGLEEDSPGAIRPPAGEQDAGLGEGAPLEDRCKARWDASEDLRAEFGNDFDAFVAYERANTAGQVRRLSNVG